MNSSPSASNENSDVSASEAPVPKVESPTDQQLAEADLAAETPKTLLLKRGNSPLFVPATLPEEVDESAPQSATSGSPVEVKPVEAETVPSIVVKTAPLPEPTSPEPTSPQSTFPQSTFPTVDFFPPGNAIYQASVTLELRCTLPESTVTESTLPKASIRYALDAQDVAENGLLYDPAQKIFLTQSTSVAARAWVDEQSGPLSVARFEIAQPGWQKLEPTDQSDPTTHEAQDEATLEGPWRLAAASVRGKLHAHRAGWREDAFRHGLANAADGAYSVVVVSDGAGSAPLSRVGSNLLCQTVLDFLRPALEKSAPLSSDSKELAERDLPLLRGLLVESARLGLQKMREEAAHRSRPLSDFASTLLILVRREWNGQQLCAALQSGDGGIALWNDDDTLTLLGAADHGEHSSETRFLTSSGMEDELAARVKFSIRPNLRATAVMTDGVADDFFPETVRFPELFQSVLPLFAENNAPSAGSSSAALLQWINYEKKGSSDDRALVVSWRVADPASVSSSKAEGN
ncbi:Protein phosphatase 2C [Abditibacterium utsteinense]|uniref:Protein phosphatase 2C n=1 Tax=Abditibacterium utsteinense TaxID=1960156 RepID=A0A2S8SS01_9BACT|nr:PP2C family serine/threonine-protein phosphatase [Abditibacterium utsteinense]PQV63581.1 Protein phosphatase 2C [Abditibacterium utsteinense]